MAPPRLPSKLAILSAYAVLVTVVLSHRFVRDVSRQLRERHDAVDGEYYYREQFFPAGSAGRRLPVHNNASDVVGDGDDAVVGSPSRSTATKMETATRADGTPTFPIRTHVVTQGKPRTATTLLFNMVAVSHFLHLLRRDPAKIPSVSLRYWQRPNGYKALRVATKKLVVAKSHLTLDNFLCDNTVVFAAAADKEEAAEMRFVLKREGHAVAFVQDMETLREVGIAGLVDEYVAGYGLSEKEKENLNEYFSSWEILRQCCGQQMSQKWRNDLMPEKFKIPQYGTHPRCATYDIDKIEQTFMRTELYALIEKYPSIQPLNKPSLNDGNLNGTYCSSYNHLVRTLGLSIWGQPGGRPVRNNIDGAIKNEIERGREDLKPEGHHLFPNVTRNKRMKEMWKKPEKEKKEWLRAVSSFRTGGKRYEDYRIATSASADAKDDARSRGEDADVKTEGGGRGGVDSVAGAEEQESNDDDDESEEVEPESTELESAPAEAAGDDGDDDDDADAEGGGEGDGNDSIGSMDDRKSNDDDAESDDDEVGPTELESAPTDGASDEDVIDEKEGEGSGDYESAASADEGRPKRGGGKRKRGRAESKRRGRRAEGITDERRPNEGGGEKKISPGESKRKGHGAAKGAIDNNLAKPPAEFDRTHAIFLISFGEEAAEGTLVERCVLSLRRGGKWDGYIIVLTDAPPERYENEWDDNVIVVHPRKEHLEDADGTPLKFTEENLSLKPKRFKTFVIDYVDADERLDSVELIYYLDIDIVAGNSMPDLFAEVERRYQVSRKERTQGKSRLYFFTPLNTKGWPLQGGTFIVERKSSRRCLELWRREIDLLTTSGRGRDQDALKTVYERIESGAETECGLVRMENRNLVAFPTPRSWKRMAARPEPPNLVHIANSVFAKWIDEETQNEYISKLLRLSEEERGSGKYGKATLRLKRSDM